MTEWEQHYHDAWLHYYRDVVPYPQTDANGRRIDASIEALERCATAAKACREQSVTTDRMTALRLIAAKTAKQE